MTTEIFSFRIGDINALVAADDITQMTPERFNGIFNQEDAEDIREAFTHLDRPLFSRNGLFLDMPEHRVLVDTGEGRIIGKLAAAGISAEDISLLIITHFHGDHVNGMLTADGAPVFPNAQVIASRVEWDYWTSDAVPDERRQGILRIFEPYTDRILLVEDGDEITPGIYAILMPGHTPGQMGLHIISGDAALLHIADVAHVPLQGHFIERVPRFDYDPETAIDTRRVMFARSADDGVMLFAYHFPFPGIGQMSRSRYGFDWTPFEGQ